MRELLKYIEQRIKNRPVISLIAFVSTIVLCAALFFGMAFLARTSDSFRESGGKDNYVLKNYDEINDLRATRRDEKIYFDFIEIPLPQAIGIKVDLRVVMKDPYMDIILDKGDIYEVAFFMDNVFMDKILIDTQGKSLHNIDLSSKLISSGYDSVVIKPLEGKHFGAAYINFYQAKEQKLSLEDIPNQRVYLTTDGEENNRPYDVTGLQTSFVDYQNGELVLEILSVHQMNITANHIQNGKGKIIGTFEESTEIPPFDKSADLDKQYKNYVVKDVKEEDVLNKGSLYISYRIQGAAEDTISKIYPFDRYNHELFNSTNVRMDDNIYEFDFINIQDDILTFTGENITIDRTMFIPKGYVLKIDEGQRINLINGAYIVSRSSVLAEGTEEKPVHITTDDGTGRGIVFIQAENKSELRNVVFTNLNTPASGAWILTGAVTFYESDVVIDSCVFRDNVCEDALNTVRSDFEVKNSRFENTFADAFDSDFCVGVVKDCSFVGTGNDGVDFSTSTVSVLDTAFLNIGDKAISGGEKSTIDFKNIRVNGAEVGVTSKDTSVITGQGADIRNVTIGFAMYRKKPEFNGGKIDVFDATLNGSIGIDYIIEKGSELKLDGKLVLRRAAPKENILIEKLINGEPIT